MDLESAPSLPRTQPEELLVWRRPQVQKLVIHLDTAGFEGSNIDGEGGALFESDLRLKKDVAAIKDALDGILSLRGVTYRYDTSGYPEMGLSKDPQIGFIAQELEQVYPELVKTREDGFRLVNYAQLVPVLVEAIKQQQSMIDELQEHVRELQRTSPVGTLH